MKIRELTQINYDRPEKLLDAQNNIQKTIANAENDETESCSTIAEEGNRTTLEIAVTFTLTCGFPFILMIVFTALAAFLTEKSLGEFIQQITWPAGILAAITILSLPLSLGFARLSESKERQSKKNFA